MPERNIDVLVTGATGWLGKALVRALLHGIEGVAGLPVLPAGGKMRLMVLPGESTEFFKPYARQTEIVYGDIRSLDDCDRLMLGARGAVLYHIAGVIHPKRVAEFRAVNVMGTINLLSAAQKAGVKRVVAVSSNSPVGCNPTSDHVFDENSPYNPYMGYGRSKMEMEQVVACVQAEGRLETVCVRAPWFYGPFQPARQSLFFKMIRDGKVPVVGDGINMRSMTYVDNLAQGLILAGHVGAANGKVYWIADQRPYTMNEIIETIESVLEEDFSIPCAHKRIVLPTAVGEIAFWLDKGIQLTGFYCQKIHVLSEMHRTIACSIALAQEELGYRPSVALRAGMKKSIEWMMKDAPRVSTGRL